jgi:hypothetical protein
MCAYVFSWVTMFLIIHIGSLYLKAAHIFLSIIPLCVHSATLYGNIYELTRHEVQGCWQVLSPTRKETSYSYRRFWCSYILFIIIIGGIFVIFTYITRLASNEIFSPSNKIHWEVGRAKDLSAPWYRNVIKKSIYLMLVLLACRITEYTDVKLNMMISAVTFAVNFTRPSVN